MLQVSVDSRGRQTGKNEVIYIR